MFFLLTYWPTWPDNSTSPQHGKKSQNHHTPRHRQARHHHHPQPKVIGNRHVFELSFGRFSKSTITFLPWWISWIQDYHRVPLVESNPQPPKTPQSESGRSRSRPRKIILRTRVNRTRRRKSPPPLRRLRRRWPTPVTRSTRPSQLSESTRFTRLTERLAGLNWFQFC